MDSARVGETSPSNRRFPPRLCAAQGIYASLVRRQLTKSQAILDQDRAEDRAEARAASDTIDKLLGA